jgi:hypothetical protein
LTPPLRRPFSGYRIHDDPRILEGHRNRQRLLSINRLETASFAPEIAALVGKREIYHGGNGGNGGGTIGGGAAS